MMKRSSITLRKLSLVAVVALAPLALSGCQLVHVGTPIHADYDIDLQHGPSYQYGHGRHRSARHRRGDRHEHGGHGRGHHGGYR